MTIARPQREVYEFWNAVDNLPRFIRGLERVEQLGGGLSRWTWIAPAGLQLQWEAEIINAIEPELIAWRSLPGADLVSAGSVHFTALARGGTAVTVSMQYAPPGGVLANAAGWVIGRGPASELKEDLRRLKRLLETGEEPTATGQASGARSHIFKTVAPVTA